ncbi:Long-chain base-1-phosphate phosphatase [Vanrija albida]|uniref:Long-chain base-1-phosphate phosphatase n=1 Tax=Vanrija albida TaxID=181172 RepID=A0ABR3PV70_9TREE
MGATESPVTPITPPPAYSPPAIALVPSTPRDAKFVADVKEKPANGSDSAPPPKADAAPPPANGTADAKPKLKVETHHHEPGCQPESVYENALSPWRESLRRMVMAPLAAESEWLAEIQQRVRTPGRDRYFFWSAVFGTHTFFTAFLPMLFFFGYPEKGRALLHVVGLGIYTSCVAKDLVCSPRPYSPPVTRLSVSTHHREYGFPSSHSANASSIALFVAGWLWEERETVGWTWLAFGWSLLLVYYVSVAGGRLYSGMHSTIDVGGGTILGVLCWLIWHYAASASEAWVNSGTVLVPIVMIPATLALIHYHPETPDDCPCFEDAIAIMAVILGSFVGHWDKALNNRNYGPSIWRYGAVVGAFLGLLRVVIGIALIFFWRLAAKKTMLTVLPELYRSAAKLFRMELPTRRFYTPATAYKGVADVPLRSIPSFMDLTTADSDQNSPTLTPQSDRSVSPMRTGGEDEEGLRMRKPKPSPLRRRLSQVQIDPVASNGSYRGRRLRALPHYDAEVITKLVVYAGIGLLATAISPMLFPLVEVNLGFP